VEDSPAVSSPDRVQRVRDMWEAFVREGVDGLRRHTDDEVEWTLSGGHTIRGLDALAAHLRVAPEVAAVPHVWEEHGECVLVHGSLRTFQEGGFMDVQPSWVYFFRGERLMRAVTFPSREAALEAIARHGADGNGEGDDL
jgi:ketosteroid isomerase-like protein